MRESTPGQNRKKKNVTLLNIGENNSLLFRYVLLILFNFLREISLFLFF